MDRLKKLFGGHSSQPVDSATSTGTPASGAGVENAQNVVLHTTLGDITVALYSDKTPKVSCGIESQILRQVLTECPDLQELRNPCTDREVRWGDLSPYYQRLHDPG